MKTRITYGIEPQFVTNTAGGYGTYRVFRATPRDYDGIVDKVYLPGDYSRRGAAIIAAKGWADEDADLDRRREFFLKANPEEIVTERIVGG